MALAIVMLVVGLVVLLVAGALLVRSASRLSFALGMSPMLIAGTVVAFGTSTPELFISVTGAVRGSPGLAAGNVAGSNIANVLLVLGVAAVIMPVAVHRRLLRLDIPVLIAATALILLFSANGTLARWEGAVCLLALAVFTFAQIRWFSSPDQSGGGEAGLLVTRSRPRIPVEASLLLAMLAALVVGSLIFVEGAVELAEIAGMSEFAIGATVVAVGTSLPEVAISGMAAWRREGDIAVANVIGSNMFNALGVLGASAVASPLAIDRSIFVFEMPVLALATLVLVPLAWPRFRIGRTEGVLLLAAFVSFIVVLLVRGG